jgi:Rap1a immunity proteins
MVTVSGTLPGMKAALPLSVLLLSLSCPSRSPADLTLNGLVLRDQCQAVGLDPAVMTGMQGLKAMSCLGFVHGVVDGWILAGKPLCVPDQVSFSEESLVVSKYLRGHPEELHLEPAVLVIKAMNHAWPCK